MVKLSIPVLICEFVGSLALVLAGFLGEKYLNELAIFPIFIFISYGLLFLLLSPMGAGCLNPAVVISELLNNKRLSVEDAASTILVQLMGGFIGALCGYLVTLKTHSYSTEKFILPSGSSVQNFNIFLAEALFSSIFIFFYTHGSKNLSRETALLLVGSLIGSWGAIGSISGAVLNPAVSMGCDLAAAVVTGLFNMQRLAIYLVAPFFGGIVAWFANRLTSHFLWSELLGTAFVSLTTACALSTKASDLHLSVCISLMYLCTLYSIGHTSGGHYNAAVSIGSIISPKNRVSDVLSYVVMQLCGGVLAVFSASKICATAQPIHNVLEEGDKNGQILMLCILFSMALMAAYTIEFVKFFGDPPGFAIGTVYLCNYLWSRGKSEINPIQTASVAALYLLEGKSIDLTNCIASALVPIGGCLFSMAMIKNFPANRPVDI